MGIKILLDTDIGSDIDDAVCLAYLLANPACELLGITTVTGEADVRASMASAMCKVAGNSHLPGPFRTAADRSKTGACAASSCIESLAA